MAKASQDEVVKTAESGALNETDTDKLELILDIPVAITVEIGRT